MIKLVVAGSKGRMGQMIMQMAAEHKLFNLILGFDQGDDPSIIKRGDVVVDFTVPVATMKHVKVAESSSKAMVIGTTGLSSSDMAIVGQAALKVPIVHSSNMSRGMNVLFKEAQNVAKYLKPREIKITETHHVHKKDSPSG